MKSADEILKPWPKAWMGMKEDKVYGEKLVLELRPFVEWLLASGLAKNTVERHLGNLFLMGGEIVRNVSIFDDYDVEPAKMLRDSVDEEGGPLCQHLHTDAQLRAYDATCRKLYKFLNGLL